MVGSQQRNVFLNGRPSPYDTPFIVIMLIISMFVGWAAVDNLAYATIYMPLVLFSFVILIAGVAFKGRYVSEVVLGSIRNKSDWPRFYITIAITTVVSLAIAALLYYSVASWLGLPFAIAQVSNAPIAIIILTYSVFLVFIEAVFFFSTILPTIIRGLHDTTLIAVISMIGAVVFYFFIQATYVALALVALAAIFIFSKLANKEIAKTPVSQIFIGIIFVGVLWAFFHIPAYSAAPAGALLVSLGVAFVVFVLVAMLCVALQNTIPAFGIIGTIDATLLTMQLHAYWLYVTLPLIVFTGIFAAAIMIRISKSGAVSANPAV